MNNKFDELTKGLAQSVTRRGALKKFGVGLAGAVLLGLAVVQFSPPAQANDFRLGPAINLSDPDALAACGSNGAEKEAYIAVNPTNPKNIVASWWGGLAKGIVTAVSFDGGKGWRQVVVPGITLCTGGRFDAAFDNWLTFAPNGELYVSCVAGNYLPSGGDINSGAILISKSTDGGLRWSSPVTLFEGTGVFARPDKPSSTADPTDARLVYAVWHNEHGGNRGEAMFSRTTDGGRSWESARMIYVPGTADLGTIGHQILVLPDGTLVDLFTEDKFASNGRRKDSVASLLRSTDKGQTWSLPVRIATIPTFTVTDPDTGAFVVNDSSYSTTYDVAVDRNNGNLYAVWEDNGFSNGEYSSIAFSISADGGFTWSAPIPVNRTPGNVAPANRQAFIPAVRVAADGTIAVTYYDFRNNTPDPGALTDYWLVHCHPSAATPATNPANWGDEVRLTATSFDIEGAATPGGAYFLGDYEGLASIGNDFVAAWSQPHDADKDSVFFRRVGQ